MEGRQGMVAWETTEGREGKGGGGGVEGQKRESQN